MTIGRMNPLDPIQPVKTGERTDQVKSKGKVDSVSISEEAFKKADLLHAIDIVSAAPDVRADLVAEMKKKINDPAYINDIVLNGAAEKIIDVLWPNAGDGPLKL
ncbi:hypothetical protein FACS1894190_02820 [Spirochaetia bacterium]|nr:hypothetical protein FACS1894190_02820 [Spirochaetia bacterium]GHV20307.1 hypothetical protein FACS189494_03810 [Spirochaetia bacterium]